MVKVGIVGAGGLVGTRLVESLSRRTIDIDLLLTGHNVSPGKSVSFRGGQITIRKTRIEDLKKCDVVVLCTPTKVSLELAKEIKGVPLIIDTSSAFRMSPEVPLVIPEVNGEDLELHKGIVAGPNCSTIQMVMAIAPLHRELELTRVIVSTYQSCSGAGYRAMRELEELSLKRLLEDSRDLPEDYQSEFGYPIAFNLIPQIDEFLPSGYTKEEMKMVNETRKIMHLPDLPVAATCVRVPVFIGHSLSLAVETRVEPQPEEVRRMLSRFPGIVVLDELRDSVYPMPLYVEGKEEVFVGRIRKDLSNSNSVLLWVVADNLLRGAATNACNILERVIREHLF